jgi:hypothetical protein
VVRQTDPAVEALPELSEEIESEALGRARVCGRALKYVILRGVTEDLDCAFKFGDR